MHIHLLQNTNKVKYSSSRLILSLQNIYRSVVLAKLLYASSSWIGFSNATDRQKLQAFLNRSKRTGFCDSETDDFATLCSAADKPLFNRILNQPEHVLHPLLPPTMVVCPKIIRFRL